MSGLSWWAESPPWVHVIASDSQVTATEALPPNGAIFAARLHGQDMADADGVFTQFYESFRLPDYFGWNWDALYDCLSDLNWIPATRYILIIEGSENVLSGSMEERSMFFRTLLRSAESWASRPEFPEQPKSTFHVIFVCDSGARDELTRETRELT
ncbi:MULTISPECIES: barstar family protein [unclassified Streptomyces]|uniref:Barstar family protein n=1 Tax=Streptomyces sp. NBC_00180 TaxID=2903632 RepID=A0AAU1I496_9ACTN|nr:barstar family protein [Streptomyces sp. NBC_01017]